MIIFDKKTARHQTNAISLNINNLKFFDMGKNTTKNPILQRNGVKNSTIHSISETYDNKLDGLASPRGSRSTNARFIINEISFSKTEFYNWIMK